MSGPPLTGLRVLDISHSLAGPLTAMHLGDLGAEVVKVEAPAGDDWRRHEIIPGQAGRGRHYMQVNRNKRAVCLDLGRPAARAALHDLVTRSDVLVTNLAPGAPERLGFGWDACRALNPGLVYCALTAWGPEGPRAARRGYDITAQALAGLMRPGPEGDAEPRSTPIPVTDTACALLAATGVLAALVERGRTGRGQRVDTSLLGTAAALRAHALVRIDALPDHGTRTFSRAFFRAYRTGDGWIAVAAISERLAGGLCAALGMPGLLERPPWDDRVARAEREDELAAVLAPAFAGRTTAAWDDALAAAGVPAAPVSSPGDLFDDDQARAAGLVEEVADEEVGPITMTAPVVRLSDTPGAIRFAGRHLGADTREVLRELGRSDAEIDDLVAGGAAWCRPPAED